jgi:hypothetical protein
MMVSPAALTQRVAGRRLRPATFLVEPFDLFLHSDEQGLYRLQARLSAFARSLDGPARFATWHIPTSLRPLIEWTVEEATGTDNPWRTSVLMEYRQWYEELEREGGYQQAVCGLTVWTEAGANAHGLGLAAQAAIGTRVVEAPWPPLVRGEYRIKPTPLWHLSPVGRPSGRPVVCLLSSYAFKPVEWTFFRPLALLFSMDIPIAVCVDIPRTWESHEAVARLEGVVTAMNAHLAGSRGLDTTGQRQIADCTAALADIHAGQSLHDVQLKIAVAAQDGGQLKDRVDEVRKRLKPFAGLRVEPGAGQVRAARYFSDQPTARLDGSPPTWPMTSDTVALTLGFLGMRKLEPRPGIIRGVNVGGGFPYIYDDWDLSAGKKATHEVWVGTTGMGKTFALNCFLARSLAHYGIPFDLLEPMGHGRLLGAAFNIDAFSLSARRTCLNPHDPVYARLGEQTAHVIGLYETFLQRRLGGDPLGNLHKALLSQALHRHYRGKDLAAMTPAEAPLVEEVCETLATLGGTERVRRVAREFAEEVAGLATGAGPFGHFLNGHTNVDFSIRREEEPRIFCFHEMEEDDVLVAIAYTQVLAALMRTAMADERPRIIAVDEVYRMMKHPSLLDFLIIAVKVLRTRRKKVIVIDQQMRIFLSDPKTRLLFENCPIRVIFGQKGGEDVFYHDPAFAHLTDQHRKLIAALPRFRFMMETDEGIFYLNSAPSRSELRRYGTS